jgi:membrane protein DedA with SNARE-associated domain
MLDPATLERIVDGLTGESLHRGYAVVFGVLVLCGFGLPLPEDIILVTGGLLAWRASPLEEATLAGMLGDRGLLTMIAFGMGGILAGDSIIFLAGRKLGHRVAEFGPLRRIVTPQKLTEAEKLLRRRGNLVVVVARFLPGLRAPTYFTVGHAKLPYWEFLLFDGAAALVSAPLWVCLGFYFGSNIAEALRTAGRFSNYILAGVLAVVAALVFRWWRRRRAAAAAGDGAPPRA